MHILFIPYGKRSEVELLFRDMEAQKHKLLMWKGKKKRYIWIQGAVRQLPLGIYEYICPKEDMDTVLYTLDFETDRYNLGWKLGFLRKLIRCKKIPDYQKEHHYLWIRENVTIIPLGLREDVEFTDDKGESKGWTHEAL